MRLVDTGEVLDHLPGTFQQHGGHKRDISCSFTSSFLSPGHEMATKRSQRVLNERSATTTLRKMFRESRRGSYFLGLTDPWYFYLHFHSFGLLQRKCQQGQGTRRQLRPCNSSEIFGFVRNPRRTWRCLRCVDVAPRGKV